MLLYYSLYNSKKFKYNFALIILFLSTILDSPMDKANVTKVGFLKAAIQSADHRSSPINVRYQLSRV